MTLRTSDERSLVVALVKGNRFAVTGFEVRTPQDGSAQDALTISAQSWVDRGDEKRIAVTDLEPTQYLGLAQILPILDRVGELYEQARQQNVHRAQAQYIALRDALNDALKNEQRFPTDAETMGEGFSTFV